MCTHISKWLNGINLLVESVLSPMSSVYVSQLNKESVMAVFHYSLRRHGKRSRRGWDSWSTSKNDEPFAQQSSPVRMRTSVKSELKSLLVTVKTVVQSPNRSPCIFIRVQYYYLFFRFEVSPSRNGEGWTETSVFFPPWKTLFRNRDRPLCSVVYRSKLYNCATVSLSLSFSGQILLDKGPTLCGRLTLLQDVLVQANRVFVSNPWKIHRLRHTVW